MQFSPSALEVLVQNNIAFENWRISDDERKRISNTPVGVAAFYSPGSLLGHNEIKMLQSIEFLIALDISYLKSGLLTGDEQIGIILHELGHIINPAPYEPCSCMNPKLDEELYADYYTIHCGYGAEFALAMSKMREAKIYGFTSTSIEKRITELKSPSAKRLNLRLT